LARLALAIHNCGHELHSAHVATYGERAVDVFYLSSAKGQKLSHAEADQLRAALLDAARDDEA
jgi:[protein-PII] uridylyltransferase